MPRILLALLSLLSLFGCAAAAGAEIVLHPSAVDAALRRELFNRDGRYVISGDPRTCAYAALDSPRSSFRNGRYVLRARFVASTAAQVGNQCVGGGDTFWLTVSAEPFYADDVLSLRNARVEEALPLYRPLIEIFIAAFAPRALAINLREEVARVLGGAKTPYTVSVTSIAVQSILASEDRLRVKFDFQIEAR